MTIPSFADLKRDLLSLESVDKKRVVVANATDEHTLQSVLSLYHEGLITPILVGDEKEIISLLETLKEEPKDFAIIHGNDDTDTAQKSVTLIKEDKADVLMKGHLQTRDLLKAVVNKENGIREQKVLSHVAINEVPSYHKLLFITDGGMMLTPDLPTKEELLKNALSVTKALGYDETKIGVLDATENVNPKLQASLDAAELKKLSGKGDFAGSVIEGPISLDLSISKEIAKEKEYNSPVAGEADILLVPDIITGNVLGKSLTTLAGGKMAGLIVGAKCPIVLTSRGSSTEEKLNSLILAISL